MVMSLPHDNRFLVGFKPSSMENKLLVSQIQWRLRVSIYMCSAGEYIIHVICFTQMHVLST